MNRFFLSDHHFRHGNIYSFVGEGGERIRPWAENADEADAMMVEAHNEVVKNGDTTYFMGDVAINVRGLDNLAKMNGRKILIRGNHDIFKLKKYTEHFADIRGTHKIDKVIFSHYPLHEDSLPKWCLGNAHGHTHERAVRTEDGLINPRYLNMCVETVGLRPLHFDEVVMRLEEQQNEAKLKANRSDQETWTGQLRGPGRWLMRIFNIGMQRTR